jgi:uncharacterized protein (UPF0332 family)
VTDENRRENLIVELEKGAASLQAAELCLGAGLWDDAVSRAYYAAYHHVQAVLFSEGLEARTHAGTHDLFYLHFVRTGLVPARLAKLFAALQRYREQADYSRAFHFTAEGAREEAAHARELCAGLADWLAARGFSR